MLRLNRCYAARVVMGRAFREDQTFIFETQAHSAPPLDLDDAFPEKLGCGRV